MPIPEESEGEPLKNWMIAVIAAVGGVLLISIVILVLCCFMRRKKKHLGGGTNFRTALAVNHVLTRVQAPFLGQTEKLLASEG